MKFRKLAQTVNLEGDGLTMGGKGALNYLPIVPKASIYVPKVMRKPVMGDNTVSETFTHVFLFRSGSSSKSGLAGSQISA